MQKFLYLCLLSVIFAATFTPRKLSRNTLIDELQALRPELFKKCTEIRQFDNALLIASFVYLETKTLEVNSRSIGLLTKSTRYFSSNLILHEFFLNLYGTHLEANNEQDAEYSWAVFLSAAAIKSASQLNDMIRIWMRVAEFANNGEYLESLIARYREYVFSSTILEDDTNSVEIDSIDSIFKNLLGSGEDRKKEMKFPASSKFSNSIQFKEQDEFFEDWMEEENDSLIAAWRIFEKFSCSHILASLSLKKMFLSQIIKFRNPQVLVNALKGIFINFEDERQANILELVIQMNLNDFEPREVDFTALGAVNVEESNYSQLVQMICDFAGHQLHLKKLSIDLFIETMLRVDQTLTPELPIKYLLGKFAECYGLLLVSIGKTPSKDRLNMHLRQLRINPSILDQSHKRKIFSNL